MGRLTPPSLFGANFQFSPKWCVCVCVCFFFWGGWVARVFSLVFVFSGLRGWRVVCFVSASVPSRGAGYVSFLASWGHGLA